MTDAELIKSKIDIIDFLSEYIDLKKAGRHFKARCPFHNEKTPSFIVSPERQSWHCFGACGEGGDIISFLEKWENVDFLEALKILAQRCQVTLSQYAPSEEARLKDRLLEMHKLAGSFFHYLLTDHKMGSKANNYLEKRGVRREIIKSFLLGYAADSWESLNSYLKKRDLRKKR